MTTESTTPAPEPVTPPQGTEPQSAETPPTEPVAPGQAPAELRAHADRQEAKAKAMRDQLVEVRLQEMGLDKGLGVGKAIFQSYDSEDLSPEAVREYAKSEWGHEAPASPQAAQATQGAERAAALDQAANQTTPSVAPDAAAQIDAKMLDPENITRPDVEASISSKIGRFLSSNR